MSASAFIDGNFAQAKEKAKLEHKMLLVKFTAKWCLPCKWMDKTVFQDSQVIEFLNDKIVGISVDVDDSEGVALQSEYQVKLLPTMLLFHPEGNLLDRKVSSQNSTDVTKWIADQMSLNHITPIQKVEPELSYYLMAAAENSSMVYVFELEQKGKKLFLNKKKNL